MVCPECHLRLIIDVNQPGVQYCTCNKIKRAANLPQPEGNKQNILFLTS